MSIELTPEEAKELYYWPRPRRPRLTWTSRIG
jgi:hypothetical protein